MAQAEGPVTKKQVLCCVVSLAKALLISDFPAFTCSEIEQWRTKLSEKTVEQLKSLLKLNYMTVTGVKSDLVDRVAESVVKGCVPRCPRCRVPVLRYRDATGTFECPGVYSAGEAVCVHRSVLGAVVNCVSSHTEKQRMLECSYKVDASKVKRFPWKWT
jgi:hypothetical protein